MSMLKDLWTFIKIQPNVYSTIRKESKMLATLIKSELEYGRVNTFLTIFEAEMDSIPNEFIVFTLTNFLDMYRGIEEKDIHEKDAEALLALEQYCIKYGVEFHAIRRN